MSEQTLTNCPAKTKRLSLFLFNVRRTPGLTSLTVGIADDTMVAAMFPNVATPDPEWGVPRNTIPTVLVPIAWNRLLIFASTRACFTRMPPREWQTQMIFLSCSNHNSS